MVSTPDPKHQPDLKPMLTSFARLAGDDDSAEAALMAGTAVVLDEECGPAAEKRVFELFVVKTFDLKNELFSPPTPLVLIISTQNYASISTI